MTLNVVNTGLPERERGRVHRWRVRRGLLPAVLAAALAL